MVLFFHLVIAFLSLLVACNADDPPKGVCPTSTKKVNDECVQITDEDIYRAVHFLASPPELESKSKCMKMTTIQGIDICEDYLSLNKDNNDNKCRIWSVISSIDCNHYGSLEFEKYWSSRGCQVTLFTYAILKSDDSDCEYKRKAKAEAISPFTGLYTEGLVLIPEHPNLIIIRGNLWGGRKGYSPLYRSIATATATLSAVDTDKKNEGNHRVDVLKIQRREGVHEDLDGVSVYRLPSGVCFYIHSVMCIIFCSQQLILTSSPTLIILHYPYHTTLHYITLKL